jgi:serine phosphatase RsbU (regulator of sigma subunit)/ActR/RegA family two-component response regulator
MTLTVPSQQSTSDSLRILLLEDYTLDAELVQTQLLRKHPAWVVEHVNTRQRFFDAVTTHKPDIIVSDYSLPQFSGLEAFKMVDELGLNIPFIILTGYLPEETARECIVTGIDDYVLKSSLPRLDHAIIQAIQKRSAQDERNDYAEQLGLSEARYRAIFEHAGVALVEFVFNEDLNLILREPNTRLEIKRALRNVTDTMTAAAINHAALQLFEATDRNAFNASFGQFFGKNGLRIVLNTACSIQRGESNAELLLAAHSAKGHFRKLLIKTVYDASRPNSLTVSFTDMTAVHMSEVRAMKLVERLEDTVAQRVAELSDLNAQLKSEAADRERINEVLRNNYIQMTESIIAAKRIQQLLLPSANDINNGFRDAFIYMRPKGIVSGDFYWYHAEGDVRWIACVDCTGHGVPGAFMSMLSSKLLNQAVIEQGIDDPAAVLLSIDAYVVKELKQREIGTRVSTGMDISLCRIDVNTQELTYAGAYQFLIHKRGDSVDTIKGDRISLGGTHEHHQKAFTKHAVQLESGDCLYMFTDGLVDQFGGPKNKKFTRRRLIEFIRDLDQESMYQQEMAIKSKLQDWKGAQEQVDDILMMGIRI